MKSTGIELIRIEREEQIEKHGISLNQDVIFNKECQLSIAAGHLIYGTPYAPDNWDETIWNKMINKSYEDRLVIAGALIAAEIDRMLYINSLKNNIEY